MSIGTVMSVTGTVMSKGTVMIIEHSEMYYSTVPGSIPVRESQFLLGVLLFLTCFSLWLLPHDKIGVTDLPSRTP